MARRHRSSRPDLCVFDMESAKDFARIAIDFACSAKDSSAIFKDSKDVTFASEHTSSRTTDDTDGTDKRSQSMSHELTIATGSNPLYPCRSVSSVVQSHLIAA